MTLDPVRTMLLVKTLGHFTPVTVLLDLKGSIVKQVKPCVSTTSLSKLGKQPVFREANTGFPVTWGLSETIKRRNSILIMCHHPYLGSASDWLKICFIQSEAISRSDQYGISALISQKSFRGEIKGGVMKYRLFSGASMMFSALKVSKNCWKIKPFCELKSRNYQGSVNLVYNYSFFTDIDECKQDPCQNGASCKVNIMNWHHNIFFPRQVHGYGRK